MTTTTLEFVAPSPSQISFIEDLLQARAATDEQIAATKARIAEGTLSRKAASATIEKLLAMPKRVAAASAAAAPAAATGAYGELVALLKDIPCAKYAIPAAELETLLEKTQVHGDLLFVEVKEYKKRLYMRKLTGSVGGFSRWKIELDDSIAIAGLIKADPYKYTKLFGEHYSCCGKCGAELTDPVSRELFLGPTCRKSFGY